MVAECIDHELSPRAAVIMQPLRCDLIPGSMLVYLGNAGGLGSCAGCRFLRGCMLLIGICGGSAVF